MQFESVGAISVSLSECQWRTILDALMLAVIEKRAFRENLGSQGAAHAEEDVYLWLHAVGLQQGWKFVP